MNTVIYYFSGTGNSLFIARELQKELTDSKIVPITSMMNSNQVQNSYTTVGFVFPVHALTIPIVVRKFIATLNLSNVEYIFAVANRGGGTVFHGFKRINQILKKQNKRLCSEFMIEMCNNDSRTGIYQAPAVEEMTAVKEKAMHKLGIIKETVMLKNAHFEDINDHTYQTASNPIAGFMIERMVIAAMEVAALVGGANYFYHDNRCTGCGICEKVCLSGKIRMTDGKPEWQKEKLCYMCFACLNFCPIASVQIKDIPYVKSNTRQNERYPHPYATVADMQLQKTDVYSET